MAGDFISNTNIGREIITATQCYRTDFKRSHPDNQTVLELIRAAVSPSLRHYGLTPEQFHFLPRQVRSLSNIAKGDDELRQAVRVLEMDLGTEASKYLAIRRKDQLPFSQK